MFHFYSSRKIHKIFGFLTFSEGVEMEHRVEMGQYGTLTL